MKGRILFLAAALYLFTGLACATTFTVNSTDGGIVNTGTNSGSLGWCIANADQSAGPHTINVNVGSITLTGTLPAITQRMTINGNGVTINANGYPGIAVNGNASGTVIDNIKFYGGAWGFDINGVSNITVKNSSIYRFAGNGIAVVANASNITITGNEIYSNGTGGGGHGITIDATSHSNMTITNNYIGCKRGSETYDSARGFNNKNYPASLGNKNIGIEVYGADGLTITGNYSLNNGLQGIAVCGACSNFNISNNVVSYNGSHGIQLESITSGSGGKVNNNICGTNSGKTQDRGNEQSGIFSHQVTVAVSYSGNVCGCNKEMGMHMDGTQNATVNGNFLGTNAKNGTTNLGNKMGNMWISWRDGESKNNTIVNNTFAYGKQATNPSDAVISGGNSLNKSGSGFGIGIAGNADNQVNQIGKGNQFYCNAGLGIDLNFDHHFSNDLGAGDKGKKAPTIDPAHSSATLTKGKATAGDVVYVYDNPSDKTCGCEGYTLLGTATANSSGEWSLTHAAVSDMSRVSAMAVAGKNSSEFTTCCRVEAGTLVSNNDYCENGKVLSLTLKDYGGGTTYELYRNGTKVGTVTPPTFTVSGLTEGSTYTFYVKAIKKGAAKRQNSDSDTCEDSTPTITVKLPTCANYSISESIDKTAVCAGETATFTVKVSNDAAYALNNVTVVSNLPTGLTLKQSTPSTGTVSGNNWTIPTIAAHSSATLKLTVMGNSAGDYTHKATITKAEGTALAASAQKSASVSLTVHALPTATLSGTKSICEGESAPLSFAPTGEKPWTITYSDGSNTLTANLSAANKTVNATPTATTTYTAVSVTDNHGCSNTATGSAVITVNHPATLGSIATPEAICAGSTLALTEPTVTANGSTVSGAKWLLGGTEINAATPLTYAANGKTLTYQITSSCPAGGSTVTSNAVAVTVHDQATLGNITAPGAICAGNTLTLAEPAVTTNGSTVTGAKWLLEGTEISSTTPIGYADNGKTLRYEIVSSCPNQTTVWSNTVTITVKDNAQVGNISVPDAICAGGTLSLTTPAVTTNGSTVSGAKWMLADEEITAATPIAYDKNGAQLHYQINSSCGTQPVVSNTVTITVNDQARLDAIAVPDAICAGGTLSLTTPAVTTNGSTVSGAKWLLGGTEINAATPLTFADNGKTLTYQITSSCPAGGSTVTSNAVTVTVHDQATLGNITAPGAICAGNTLTLAEPAVTTNGSTVSGAKWMLAGEEITATTPIAYDKNGAALQYQINSSCGAQPIISNTVTITVNDQARLDALATPDAICAGSALNLIEPAVTTNGSTVSGAKWMLAGEEITATTPIAYDKNGATLHYQINSSCGAQSVVSNTVTITVNDQARLNALATPDAICAGSTLNLIEPAITTNGSTVSGAKWMLAGEEITAATPIAYDKNGAQLHYQINSSCGTQPVVSNAVTITVHPLPVASLSGGKSICPGEDATLTASLTTGATPWTLTWTDGTENVSNPTFSRTVQPAETKTWVLTHVSDGHGCQANPNSSATVTVLETPTIQHQSLMEACDPEVILISDALIGSTADQVRYYADPALSQPLDDLHVNVLGSRTFYARGENASGCVSKVNVIEAKRYETTLDWMPDTLICHDGEVLLWARGTGPQAADYTLTLSENGSEIASEEGGWIELDVAPDQTTQYEISAQNGACQLRRTATVTVAEIPEIELTNGKYYDIHILPVTSEYLPYTYSFDGGVYDRRTDYDPKQNGTYEVVVRDVNGCVNTAEITVERKFPELVIPPFFTPDGNGSNDTWVITNIEYYPEAKIRIYDRYHKRLAEYTGSTMGNGWDGLYRGHACGSSDYWYTITDEFFGTLAGHITLRR